MRSQSCIFSKGQHEREGHGSSFPDAVAPLAVEVRGANGVLARGSRPRTITEPFSARWSRSPPRPLEPDTGPGGPCQEKQPAGPSLVDEGRPNDRGDPTRCREPRSAWVGPAPQGGAPNAARRHAGEGGRRAKEGGHVRARADTAARILIYMYVLCKNLYTRCFIIFFFYALTLQLI